MSGLYRIAMPPEMMAMRLKFGFFGIWSQVTKRLVIPHMVTAMRRNW